MIDRRAIVTGLAALAVAGVTLPYWPALHTTPSRSSCLAFDSGAVPIGLAHGVKLERAVAAGGFLTKADVTLDANTPALRIRHAMEAEVLAAQA